MCHDNDLHCTFTQPLHRSTEHQHNSRGRFCTGTQETDACKRHLWTQGNQRAPDTEQALTVPALTCPHSYLEEVSPQPYQHCLLRLVKLLISIDWLWNLLKVTLLHTDSSASASVKPGSKALVQNREKPLNSLPSTCDTHWEAAFKELNGSHI